jgi:hypothetical protein
MVSLIWFDPDPAYFGDRAQSDLPKLKAVLWKTKHLRYIKTCFANN